MIRIWLLVYAEDTQGKIKGTTATAAATAVISLSPDKHDGVNDDARPDGAADNDTTDDDPTHTDDNGPAHIHADDATSADIGVNDENTTPDTATTAT